MTKHWASVHAEVRPYRLGREIQHLLDWQNFRTVAALLVGQPAPEHDTALRDIGRVDQPPGPSPIVSRSDESAVRDVIPAMVYQTWKSSVSLPANYAYWRRGLIEHNPNFRFVLWDDVENRSFVQSAFPWLLDLYDRLPSEIYRVDLVRPLFLLRYGGFYLDLDCESLRPLEPLRSTAGVILGRMGRHAEFDHSLPNATMGSRAGELFWAFFVAQVLRESSARTTDAISTSGPENFAGPVALKRAFDSYSKATIAAREAFAEPVLRHMPEVARKQYKTSEVVVLDPHAFFALDWNNRVHQLLIRRMRQTRLVLSVRTVRRLFPRAYSVTYWSHSW